MPDPSPQASSSLQDTTIGEFAYHIIEQQFHRIVLHQSGVLQDQDPEHLHQMRVAFRRLRTALEIFEGVVTLPKAASVAKIRTLSKSLGTLRDLDVQLEGLQTDRADQSSKTSQKALRRMEQHLQKQRRQSFKAVKKLLQSKTYQKFCQASESWLETPAYLPLAQVKLPEILPELLLPLVAQLFIHPGWRITVSDVDPETSKIMHDLRKRCKHVRYQSEFFADCYGKKFKRWIKTLKKLQDQLGQLQDSYVFLDMVHTVASNPKEHQELESLSEEHRQKALSRWDEYRQPYLDLTFRRQLYRMIIYPDADEGKLRQD